MGHMLADAAGMVSTGPGWCAAFGGGMGTCTALRNAACALWNPAWLVVSLHRPSLFGGKMLKKLDECLLGNRAYSPGVASGGEDGSGLKHEKDEVFDCIVS